MDKQISISKEYVINIDLWIYSYNSAKSLAEKLQAEFGEKAIDCEYHILPIVNQSFYMRTKTLKECEACQRKFNSLKNLASLRKDGW